MASTLPDYYALLSVPRTATTDEIRTAYRKESLRCVALETLGLIWLIYAVPQDAP